MHFSSIEYAILLTVVFVSYWAAWRVRVLRLLILLAASYLFYAWWNPVYLLLIVGSSALDFVVGNKVHCATDHSQRRFWLQCSLVGNLGLLATFKYFNFFSRSLSAALTAAGWSAPDLVLDVVVPVGISFYTFQSLSYTIDIYRGRLEPVRNPLAFFLFVAFFPQLVAGPIVRAAEFLPQLVRAPRLDPEQGGRGLFLIALGLMKKSVIADLVAVNLVDRVFETPEIYTSAEVLLGVYGYAIQIYCDFSAYSDIAIGSALLLGFCLPQNFNHPYRSATLQEFWRRWHISLSSWLRDYLYISLGGSRGSGWLTYRNLALTMLLGGLWHGAAWTFVVWGALHGGGLALTRAWQRNSGLAGLWRPVPRLVKVVLTFHFVCLGWIFFRAPNFEVAWKVLEGLWQLTPGTANINLMLWGVLLAGLGTHLIPDRLLLWAEERAGRLPGVLQAMMLVVAVLVVRYASATKVVPFIYFQF